MNNLQFKTDAELRADKAAILRELDMKERPILFSGQMVSAILKGRKTMTRREVKPQPRYRDDVSDPSSITTNGWWWTKPNGTGVHSQDTADECMAKALKTFCPYSVGMELWVRETWAPRSDIDGAAEPERGRHYCMYRANPKDDPRDPMNYHDYGGKWRPSIFMPRWASRITLEITGVRVERLHDITEGDAKAEGCTASTWGPAWQGYRKVGESLHHGSTIGKSPPDWMVDPKPLDMSVCDRTARQDFESLWSQINGYDSWQANPWVWVVSFKRIEAAQ